jgi:hypothetical protein
MSEDTEENFDFQQEILREEKENILKEITKKKLKETYSFIINDIKFEKNNNINNDEVRYNFMKKI